MIVALIQMLLFKILLPFLETQGLFAAKAGVEKWAHSKNLREIGAEEPTPIDYPTERKPGLFARMKARRDARRGQ